jgi:hypothetical protein
VGSSQVVKRQECEADHSPVSSAEVKNGGAIPPHITAFFMAQCLTLLTLWFRIETGLDSAAARRQGSASTYDMQMAQKSVNWLIKRTLKYARNFFINLCYILFFIIYEECSK